MNDRYTKCVMFVLLGALLLLSGLLLQIAPSYLRYSGACLVLSGLIMLRFRGKLSSGLGDGGGPLYKRRALELPSQTIAFVGITLFVGGVLLLSYEAW